MIANLTMHKIAPFTRGVGASLGVVPAGTETVDFSDPILPREIPLWADGYDVYRFAADQVAAAVDGGFSDVIVGGLSDLVYYQIEEAKAYGLTVYVAVTERIRDENDRFVFKTIGLRKVGARARYARMLEEECAE